MKDVSSVLFSNLYSARQRMDDIRGRFAADQLNTSESASAPGRIGARHESLTARGIAPYFPDDLALALRRSECAAVSCGSCPAGSDPDAYEGMIVSAAERHGVDADLVRAVIRAESGFRADAVSPAGARGLMQLMPSTAAALGVSDPFDPAQNIDAGVRYLKQQIDRFGSVPLALAAYNAGPGNVVKYGGVPPFTETTNYVARVMEYLAEPRQTR